MSGFLAWMVSASLVALGIGGIARFVGWLRAPQALVHALFWIALLKLLTPPWIDLPFEIEARFVAAPSPSVAVEAVAPGTVEGRAATGLVSVATPGTAVVPKTSAELASSPLAAERSTGPRESTETLAIRGSNSSAIPGSSATLPATAVPPPASSVAASPAASAISATSVAFGVWLLGASTVLLATIVRATRLLRWLHRESLAPSSLRDRVARHADSLGLARAPCVLLTNRRVPPMIVGTPFGARLVLPANLLAALSRDSVDALIVHELAHLRRRDHWLRFFEIAVRTVHWWNPVAWWALHRTHLVEEECCDAWVRWALPQAVRGYADALVATAAFLSPSACALPVASSGLGPLPHLERRLTMLFEEARTRRLGARGRLLCTTTAALALPFLPVFAQDGTKQARADERARARQDVRQDVEQARRAELELVQQQQALERERQALEEARARAEWDLLNRVANGEESATSEEWTDWVNLVQQDQERKQLGNQIDEQLLESNAKTVVPDDEVRRALSRSGELLRAAGDLAAAEALERFLAELEAQSQWNEQMRRQREDLLAERRARAEIEGQLVRDRIERLAEMQRARGASRTQETLRALGYVESNSSPAEGKSDLEGRIGQLEEKVDQLSTLLRALIDRNTEGSPGSIR